MSVLKDLGSKRFWLAVILCIGAALAVCAMGAYAVVLGLTDPGNAKIWVCFAWLVGVVIGGRYASTGKERVLLRGLLNGVISVGVFWLLGLTTGGTATAIMPWWWTVVTVLVGAVVVALLPQRKGKGNKKMGRTASGATRGR